MAEAPPVFVVTHAAPEKVRLRDRFRFVTDGLSSALAQACAVAGDKDVVIMGGGAIASPFLRAGLVDAPPPSTPYSSEAAIRSTAAVPTPA